MFFGAHPWAIAQASKYVMPTRGHLPRLPNMSCPPLDLEWVGHMSWGGHMCPGVGHIPRGRALLMKMAMIEIYSTYTISGDQMMHEMKHNISIIKQFLNIR